MFKLLPYFLIVMVLAYFCSLIPDMKYKTTAALKVEKISYIVLSIVAITFIALRFSYNDTAYYEWSYYRYLTVVEPWTEFQWSLGSSVLHQFMIHLCAYLKMSVPAYITVMAIWDVGVLFWFVKKYSCNLWLSIFLIFATGAYMFCAAAIMQASAIACCLIATHYLIQDKKWAFVAWIILGMGFQTWCIVYVVTLFLRIKPWSFKFDVIMAALIAIGPMLKIIMRVVILITTAAGEAYTIDDFSSEGVNIFRFLICILPVLFTFAQREHWRTSENQVENLIVNMAVMNGLFMWIALWGTANYFARFANYFLMFQTVALPIIFKYFNKNSRTILAIGTLIGYGMYFYYSSAIWVNLDYGYGMHTFREFWQRLFDASWFPWDSLY